MRAHRVAMAEGGGSAVAGTPGILLSIDVSRCEARPQPAILGEGLPAVQISRTEGWFEAEVRAVDASNGQQVATVAVHGHGESPDVTAVTGRREMAVRALDREPGNRVYGC
jgi:hypothetical protein